MAFAGKEQGVDSLGDVISSVGVQDASSGEGGDSTGFGTSGSGRCGDIGSSVGVLDASSGEGFFGTPSLGWCGLCEDWIACSNSDECVQCGCILQRAPKERYSKNHQNQTKTKQLQNPNKNGITSNVNTSVKDEEGADSEGPETFKQQSGQSAGCEMEWICGSGAVVQGAICQVGVEGGGDRQVVVMNPAGADVGHASPDTFGGQDEAQREPHVIDRLAVDVSACDVELELGCESDLLERDRCELGCEGDLLERDRCELGCEGDLLERDRCELGCEGDLLERERCERGCLGVESKDREIEDLHGAAAEELRAINLVGSRQKDIEDFASWLDESQLRLGTYHEEALQDWIENTEVHDGEALEVRDQLNKIWQQVEDLRHELSELCAVQLENDLVQLEDMRPDTPEEHQVVLQTRIVSNWEVSQQWDLWKPAAVAELDELVTSKEALESSDLAHIRALELKGCKVIQLPSKLVCTLKAPAGRRKIRLVACGNYMALVEKDKRSHREVVYASATSVEALRTCLGWSVRRKHALLTADIRAAFLNAQLLPRARMEAERVAKQEGGQDVGQVSGPSPGEEIIALVPPRLLVSKGLVNANTRYIIPKALYGLDQAPRDWSLCRDVKLERTVVTCGGVAYRLYRSFVEDNVWFVHHSEPRRGFEATLNAEAEAEEVSAWLIVYVNDILVGGPRCLAQATMGVIRKLWQCSEPEEVGKEKAVRFLGMDLIWLSNDVLALGQESYLEDLVGRYSHEVNEFGYPTVPLAPFFDEEKVEDPISPEQLKRTQGLLGELLWASIRTRPDITYAISKLASRTTKAPGHTFRAGLYTLAYLAGTVNMVLTYASSDRPLDPDNQRRTSLAALVQGCGDASFAPEAKKSIQCLQVFVEGNLVAWSVARQPFMTLSSCEAEMVALLDLGSFTQSMAFLVDELIQRRSDKELLGDNVASLAIYGGVSSHWRTRHLRIRARTFHERNCEGHLPAFHIAGERNPADLGTKSLPASRHWKLCQFLGLLSKGSKVCKVQGSGFSFRECLLAVILASCLRTADAQPGNQEGSGDRVLWVVVVLIIISTISVWECLRGLVRGVENRCRRRRAGELPDLPEPEPDHEGPDEPQPLQEDELVEEVDFDPPNPPEELPEPHLPDVPEPQPDIGLRRRPMPVHGPEPDDEPGPQPPRTPPPENFQGVVLGRYVDDIVLGVPQAILDPHQRDIQVQGIAPPPEPRVRVRDYEEVRQQVLREQQERLLNGMPVQPPVVLNPHWGPALVQPTVGMVRTQGNDWGGPGSVAFHPPPAHYRGDFFQIDRARGILIRWHGKSRTRLFTPEAATLPEPFSQEDLTGRRRSFITEMTRWYHVEDNFRQPRATRAMPAQWRGRTELEIDMVEFNRRLARQPHQVQ